MGGIGIVAAIGGILLAAVLVFGVVTNRRRSKAQRRRTETATADLYRSIDREDKASDPDPKTF